MPKKRSAGKGKPLHPWKILKSKRLIDDKWFALRSDSCETKEGLIIDPFYVMECDDWVEIVAFDHEDNILLIQQYRHGVGKVLTEIPSGVMEPGDGSAIETAKRELLEETGCSADRFEYVGCLHPNPARQNNRNHCVLALGTKVIQKPNLDRNEDIRFKFVPLQQLMEKIDNGEFMQALHISSLFLAMKHRGLLAIKSQ